MKAKSLLIIVSTLILGFILGMLTSAEIRHQKLKPMSFFLSEERFKEGVFSVINPAEGQKEKLEKLIEDYSKRNRDLQADFRRNIESIMKDLWSDMKPILSQEQLDKLLEMEKRRSDYYEQRSGRAHRDSARGGSDFRSRMRQPGDTSRIWDEGDSLRMRMHQDSSGRKDFQRPSGGGSPRR